MHNDGMTELLERAFERVRAFPPETRDEYARVSMSLANDEAEPVPLSHEKTAIAVSKAATERGEFAPDEEVRAVWAKHGL